MSGLVTARNQEITQAQYREILEAQYTLISKKFYEINNQWYCNVCGSPVRVTTVAHPIWDGPFEGAGSGACDYREILWCPQCDTEEPPWLSGSPIRIPVFPGQEVLVMRRLWNRLHKFSSFSTLFEWLKEER